MPKDSQDRFSNAATPSRAERASICLLCLPGFFRAGQILGLMHEFRQAPASGSPEFVERVMSGLVRREEHQPKRFGLEIMRWAAVLMFSMAAGYGFSVSEGGTKSIEWVASLAVAPSPIVSIETLGFPYPLLPL